MLSQRHLRTVGLPFGGAVMVLGAALTSLNGCGLGILDGFAPLTPFDNFHAVEPGVAYRSAQLDAPTLRLVVEATGLKTIINLRGTNEDEPWYQAEKAVADELGITLVDIPMSANALPSREALLLLYDTFITADYPILIHCQAGADRAGAASAVWRMVVLDEPREIARQQLSPLYGHFAALTPEMDELVSIFQPDRTWIEQQYPAP